MKTKLTPRAKELLRTMRDENVLDGIVPNLRRVTKFVKKNGEFDAWELAILKEDIDDLSANLAELESILQPPAVGTVLETNNWYSDTVTLKVVHKIDDEHYITYEHTDCLGEYRHKHPDQVRVMSLDEIAGWATREEFVTCKHKARTAQTAQTEAA